MKVKLNEVFNLRENKIDGDLVYVQFKQQGSTSGPVQIIQTVGDSEGSQVVADNEYQSFDEAIASLGLDQNIEQDAKQQWQEVVSGEESTLVIEPDNGRFPVDITTRYKNG